MDDSAYRSPVGVRAGRHLAVLIGVCLLAVCHLPGGASAAGRADTSASPPRYLLQYDIKDGEVLAYHVLISETVYSNGERTTSLYREDVRVETSAGGDGRLRQTVICTGTATSGGGLPRKLEPFRYYLTVDKTGRITKVENLRPWDGRQLETIWLAHVMLPEGAVAPGYTWSPTVEAYSTADGLLVLERREYEFVGVETLESVDALKVQYKISRRGRANGRDYMYTGVGAFYLARGKIVKMNSSEEVTFAGDGRNTKVITMVEVEIAQ